MRDTTETAASAAPRAEPAVSTADILTDHQTQAPTELRRGTRERKPSRKREEADAAEEETAADRRKGKKPAIRPETAARKCRRDPPH